MSSWLAAPPSFLASALAAALLVACGNDAQEPHPAVEAGVEAGVYDAAPADAPPTAGDTATAKDAAAGEGSPAHDGPAPADSAAPGPPPGWLFPAQAPTSALVKVGSDGTLTHVPDKRGDRIPDYSIAGYRGGGVPIPDVPVKATVTPASGDDTAAIEAAIAKVAALTPGSDGFRGAVLLKPGTYQISKTIKIKTSGIVLRGSGVGKAGTVVVHTGDDQEDSFYVEAGALSTVKQTELTDGYVPAGATRLGLASTTGLSKGQAVVITCLHTQKWIDTLKLTGVWSTKDFVLQWERTITAVDAAKKQVTLDGPITSQIDKAGGLAKGELHLIGADKRIRNVGFEDLTFVSDYDRSKKDSGGWYNDEQHGWILFHLSGLRDGWIRRVAAFFYGKALVRLRGGASRVTIEDTAMIDGVALDTPSNHSGSKKYYFALNGSETLTQRAYGRYGRHAFIMNGHGSSNVFLDCYSDKGHIAQEPHQRWQHGSLFDNVYSDSMLKLDRGGDPHGQRAASCALWNCVSESYRYWEPEIWLDAPLGGLGQNYVVGAIVKGQGKGIASPYSPLGAKGHVESTNKPVSPRSLYLAQLRQRLGDQAVLAVTTKTQRVSAQAVFGKLQAAFGAIKAYGDPDNLSWLPATISFEKPGP